MADDDNIHHFPDPAEMNRLLAEQVKLHNESSDPQMGGLSPARMHRLLYTPWDHADSPINIRTDLTLSDLAECELFNQTRNFLLALAQVAPLKTTATQNLPRAFVGSTMDQIVDQQHAQAIREVCKVINETDVFPLHLARVISMVAGIIGISKGCFVIRKKYAHLLKEENVGELFALILKTYLQKFDLNYLSGGRDVPGIQATIAYTLYALHSLRGKTVQAKELPEKILLPNVVEMLYGAADKSGYYTAVRIFELRVLYPLQRIGFIQALDQDKHKFDVEPDTLIHPTTLLGITLSFKF